MGKRNASMTFMGHFRARVNLVRVETVHFSRFRSVSKPLIIPDWIGFMARFGCMRVNMFSIQYALYKLYLKSENHSIWSRIPVPRSDISINRRFLVLTGFIQFCCGCKVMSEFAYLSRWESLDFSRIDYILVSHIWGLI